MRKPEKLLFIDTETYNLKEDGNICQLSFILTVEGEEKVIFNEMISPNPYCELDEDTLKFHEDTNGWSLDYLKSLQSPHEAYVKLIKTLDTYVDKFDRSDKLTCVGYNTYYDTNNLRKFFLLNKNEFYGSYFNSVNIDVMTSARWLFNRFAHLFKDFKLSTIYNTFLELGFVRDLGNEYHNALFDVKCTKELFDVFMSPVRDEVMKLLMTKLKNKENEKKIQ